MRKLKFKVKQWWSRQRVLPIVLALWIAAAGILEYARYLIL